MNELTKLPATKLIELIKTRAVSPVEIMEAHLRRIEQFNPQLNAIVTLAPDALEFARQAEAAIMRGDDDAGALCGLPVTIKDTFDTVGLLTTSGSALRTHHLPLEDAASVARLKAASAIVLGKTNVSEMAAAYESDNPVFGRTNNPHDATRTPGGSSGGEAAAISACLSPAGLGSDLSGSIRIPAHFCGIVGLKPTTGRVPSAGHTPSAEGPLSLGETIGPMARTVADLCLLLNVLDGSDAGKTHRAQLTNQTDDSLKRLRGQRVAWYVDDGSGVMVTEETKAAVLSAARALADAGLNVNEERPPAIERGAELWNALFARAASEQLQEFYAGREDEAGGFVRAILRVKERGATQTLEHFIEAWKERDRLHARLVRWMEATPLILAPVGATHAPLHDTRKIEVAGQSISLFRAFGYAQTFNVFGLPAVSVPAGSTSEGLPIGVQIIGRPFAEATVLAAASVIEEALGGWQPSME
jgi:amidase